MNIHSAETIAVLSLSRHEAARLCGVSVHTFDTWVRKKILPGPIPGTRRWSRVSVERALAHERAVGSIGPDRSPFEEWKRRNAA
jgi:hypothetical protein